MNRGLHCIPFVLLCICKLMREKIMTLFDVTVNAKDLGIKETFRLFGTSKREAMMKAIKMVRKLGEVKGEILATAKVVR
jgi:hypothetical protein